MAAKNLLKIFCVLPIVIFPQLFLASEIIFEHSFVNCTCVPYFQCSEESGQLITDGTGLFDVRGFNLVGPCTGYFDVCCNNTDSPHNPNTHPNSIHPLPYSGILSPSSSSKKNLPSPTDDNLPVLSKGCGYQHPATFPWTGALLFHQQPETGHAMTPPARYKCGVSLIQRQVVLTAAHCLDEEDSVEALGGYWTVRIGHLIHDTKSILIHPKYSTRTLQNDIALILLEHRVVLSPKVNTICIPAPAVHLEGSRCAVSLWTSKDSSQLGGTAGNGPTAGTYLKMAKLPIVTRDKCTETLRETRLGQFFQLHGSFICAGGEGFMDTCGGDGGSPLICPIPGQPGRFHQAGIVSWGIGCGENNTPGVYVNLPSFRDWIDSVLLDYGLDITEYRY